MHRSQHTRVRQCRQIRQRAEKVDADAFFNLLTGPQWFDQVESLLPAHRERLFPPTETLSMFLSQALSADRSCQNAVDEAAVKRLTSGLRVCSTHTGAFCRARQRLPSEMVQSLVRFSGQCMSERALPAWHWRGQPVRLVDGTTVPMPDTAANQAIYPQPRSQKPGLGFPLCRLLGLVCLGSGAVLNAAVGPYRGKGGDEQCLLRSVLDTLNRGELLLGDAYFATYFLLCDLQSRGVDGVFEQNGARRRSTDFRRGQRLGERDHLIVLPKPKKRPPWMSPEDYASAPEQLTVRELYASGKVLLTTLLCPKRTPKSELKALYRQRWHIELDLRHIKTTMGMQLLSCKTPCMAEKEIWVYLLAYNLIRVMMAEAAVLSGCSPRQLSFKHSVQLWISWYRYGLDCEQGRIGGLLILISQQRVGERPGSIEPRAIKRRNKPYPLLTMVRSKAREKVRRYGHPKKLK
jgi:hypothetical protein